MTAFWYIYLFGAAAALVIRICGWIIAAFSPHMHQLRALVMQDRRQKGGVEHTIQVVRSDLGGAMTWPLGLAKFLLRLPDTLQRSQRVTIGGANLFDEAVASVGGWTPPQDPIQEHAGDAFWKDLVDATQRTPLTCYQRSQLLLTAATQEFSEGAKLENAPPGATEHFLTLWVQQNCAQLDHAEEPSAD